MTEPTGTYCGVCGYVHLEGTDHGPPQPVSAEKKFLQYMLELIDQSGIPPDQKLGRLRELMAHRYRECK
jgi:hypothetical protein